MHGVGKKDGFDGLRGPKRTEKRIYTLGVKIAAEPLKRSSEKNQIGMVDLVGGKPPPRLLTANCRMGGRNLVQLARARGIPPSECP